MGADRILVTAFVLFLLALPLVSYGASRDDAALWYAGLALLAIAGVIPPATRYFGDGE